MIVNINLSQEIFAIDMLRALKSSLKHRRKRALRPLQLYGDQALLIINPRMAMNYYAIQIFHARLKVKIMKYDVNLGRQQ